MKHLPVIDQIVPNVHEREYSSENTISTLIILFFAIPKHWTQVPHKQSKNTLGTLFFKWILWPTPEFRNDIAYTCSHTFDFRLKFERGNNPRYIVELIETADFKIIIWVTLSGKGSKILKYKEWVKQEGVKFFTVSIIIGQELCSEQYLSLSLSLSLFLSLSLLLSFSLSLSISAFWEAGVA